MNAPLLTYCAAQVAGVQPVNLLWHWALTNRLRRNSLRHKERKAVYL